MEYPQPRLNPYLIGQEKAEKLFLSAWKTGVIHNSWLVCGPQGIGKATFVYKIARFLLAVDENQREAVTGLDVDPDLPACRLVAGRAHPDLKIIERDFTETDKKKIIKAIKDGEAFNEKQLQDLKKSQVIKVDEVRSVNEFLSKKSFDDKWRIVIVDSADDLNTAGANAILKILEEPPAKSLIFLVSHNPNRLLPTIRSRCTKVILQPLTDNQVAMLLRRYAPELSEAEVGEIAALSSGSIGRALNYARLNGLEIYHQLEALFYAGRKFDLAAALALADRAARDENVWDLCHELILKFAADMIKSGEKVGPLGETWDQATQMFRDTINLNMDKKQVLLNIISKICGALSDVG